MNLYDFHELALSVLPLGFAIYFLERPAGIVSYQPGLNFLIKEELPLVGVGFGAYILVGQARLEVGPRRPCRQPRGLPRRRRVIIPAFGGGSYALFARRIEYRYAEFGATPQQIIANAFTIRADWRRSSSGRRS